jgi:uncharacterized protein (TIGR02118 family)
MTVKVIVLYTQPEDPAPWDEHYKNHHIPLALALPGLAKFETGAVGTPPLDGGEATYHRFVELTFADADAVQAAFGSPEGQAAASDFQAIAPPGSRLFAVPIDD